MLETMFGITKKFRVVALSFLISMGAVYADDTAEYRKNIEEIGKQIDQISRNLNANKALLKTQQDELLEVEKTISSLSKELAITDQKINQQKQQGEDLSEEIDQLKYEQEQGLQELSTLLVSRYTNGKTNYVKMLLNQENPYAVGRLNNYYQYFAEARQEKISTLREQLFQVEELSSQHEAVLTELKLTQNQQQEQQGQLDKSKQERLNSVESLNTKVASSTEKLDRLNQDRSRLNSLLKEIAAQAERLRKLEEQRIAEEKKKAEEDAKKNNTIVKPVVRKLVEGGFVRQQGRLSYPVSGKLKYNYNSRLPESGMRSEGVFFDTNGSVSVNAIFRGRVLFADFLKGFGLLLIIDHGDDHISLYGHNELLYKQVGDSVETNELVAKTGVTGGLKTHGLYFEIRNNTTPVDPKRWWQ